MKPKLIIPAFLAAIFFTGCRDSKPQEYAALPPSPQPIHPPTVAAKRTPIPLGAVEEGRKVFEHIKSRYKQAEISIWGAGTSTPKVALWIPESDWKSLSNIEQGNLGYYVKFTVPRIRSNPGPYTGIPSSAPIYSKLISNCYNMSENSWIIGVGAYNSEGKLLLDHEAVTGTDSPWHTNETLPVPSVPKPTLTIDATVDMTTWTSSDGRTIQATMLRLEGENVILQRNDGGIFSVPLNKLSSQSQVVAKKRSK